MLNLLTHENINGNIVYTEFFRTATEEEFQKCVANFDKPDKHLKSVVRRNVKILDNKNTNNLDSDPPLVVFVGEDYATQENALWENLKPVGLEIV